MIFGYFNQSANFQIPSLLVTQGAPTMGKISLGVNMEFVRHDDKPFEWGVEKAAELGYEYVEPMVHWGRELLSEAGYFHSVSMLDDPLSHSSGLRKGRHQALGLSAHSLLCKPDDRRRTT